MKIIKGGSGGGSSFQIDSCTKPNGFLGETGLIVQPNAYNVDNAPIVWSLVSSNGDAENVSLDSGTGEITYDIPNSLSNGGRGEIIISATDASGNVVTKHICTQALDPVKIERLACDNNISVSDPLLVNNADIFAFVSEDLSNVYQDDLETLPSLDGDPVYKIIDRNGNELIANNTGGGRPVLIESEPLANGYPVLDFSQSSASIFYDTNGVGVAGEPFKMLFYFKIDATTPQSGSLLSLGDGSANSNLVSAGSVQIGRGSSTFGTPDDFVFRYSGTGGGDTVIMPFSEIADGNMHLLGITYDNPEVNIYVDGQLKVTFNMGVPILKEHYRFFRNRSANRFVDGLISEIIIGDMTTQAFDKKQAYLLCKYALPISSFSGTGPFGVDCKLYDQITAFEKHTLSDGSQVVYDTQTGTYYDIEDVPTPGLGILSSCESDSIIDGLIFDVMQPDDVGANSVGVPIDSYYTTSPSGFVKKRIT